VRKAWDDNTDYATNNPDKLYYELDRYFDTFKGKIFRIHSAGDFVSLSYFTMWNLIANNHPNIVFMAYTKRFDVLHEFITMFGRTAIKHNFKIILSSWTGSDVPVELSDSFPIAWLCEEGQNAPIMVYKLKKAGRSSLVCGGDCTVCKYCYDPMAHDVIFIKH
jgi:hypothetical protein